MDAREEFFAARDAFMRMVRNPESVPDEEFSKAADQLCDAANRLGGLSQRELEERLSAFRGK